MFLDYLALGILICVVIFVVYLVIYIHDIPYEIAKDRNHPHQDAIHIAGWVSLFLMHTIWPLLWIWAYLYKPGEKFLSVEVDSTRQQAQIDELQSQLAALQQQLALLNQNTAPPAVVNPEQGEQRG